MEHGVYERRRREKNNLTLLRDTSVLRYVNVPIICSYL